MSKADELLKRALINWSNNIPQDDLMFYIKKHLHRKGKLVVGSEWVCDVGCIGSKMSYSPYDDETVFVVDVRDFVTFTYFLYDNAHEDDMPLEQFLACFSPKEEDYE